MNYKEQLTKIMDLTPKKIINEIKFIVPCDKIKLAEYGNNDVEGFQIFTPDHIVQSMMKTIGIKKICDFNSTILEPTSGDGAFTVRILEKRIRTIDSSELEIESLKALSTIYSIEMDKELIRKQRCNVLSVVLNNMHENQHNIDNDYVEILKVIIANNFMWAKFNSDNPNTLLFSDVAYSMPEAENNKYKSIKLPVWKINDNEISLLYEDVEV